MKKGPFNHILFIGAVLVNTSLAHYVFIHFTLHVVHSTLLFHALYCGPDEAMVTFDPPESSQISGESQSRHLCKR